MKKFILCYLFIFARFLLIFGFPVNYSFLLHLELDKFQYAR